MTGRPPQVNIDIFRRVSLVGRPNWTDALIVLGACDREMWSSYRKLTERNAAVFDTMPHAIKDF